MTFQRVELQRCEIPQEPTDRSRPGVACLNTRDESDLSSFISEVGWAGSSRYLLEVSRHVQRVKSILL